MNTNGTYFTREQTEKLDKLNLEYNEKKVELDKKYRANEIGPKTRIEDLSNLTEWYKQKHKEYGLDQQPEGRSI